ncbi:MAG: TRAP transporter small permease [Candidatus Krumholzibacteriia bacterium]
MMDRLFAACGGLAAFFLAGICVLVLAQVVGRLLGIAIPSADEFAGYCLSASSFLALGYALRQNSHIRVTLLIDRLPADKRRVAEGLCVAGGLALSLYITANTVEMVYYSVIYNDLTQGLVPVPLWIPQSGMMIGVIVLSLAFLVDGVRMLRGLDPAYIGPSRDVSQGPSDSGNR